jgi:uncharacterized OsmC-like protein
MNDHRQLVLDRQQPLRRRYRALPAEAAIRDRARTAREPGDDPFHATVLAGEAGPAWRIGIHRAVGGFHDLPNPGDLLCAALASCFDTSLRMVAARLDVGFEELAVEVGGEVDVRGTLAVERDVPVGFAGLHCRVRARRDANSSDEQLARAVAAAERACVVLQTLRRGVAVSLTLDDGRPPRRAAVERERRSQSERRTT